MSTAKEPPAHYEAVMLDTSAREPRLVIQVPPEQEKAVRAALEALSHRAAGRFRPDYCIGCAPQRLQNKLIFWTPEWQAKEQAADRAIAEGRTQTFDTLDDMLDFLDAQ